MSMEASNRGELIFQASRRPHPPRKPVTLKAAPVPRGVVFPDPSSTCLFPSLEKTKTGLTSCMGKGAGRRSLHQCLLKEPWGKTINILRKRNSVQACASLHHDSFHKLSHQTCDGIASPQPCALEAEYPHQRVQ